MATATKKKKKQSDGYSPRLKDRFEAEIRDRLYAVAEKRSA